MKFSTFRSEIGVDVYEYFRCVVSVLRSTDVIADCESKLHVFKCISFILFFSVESTSDVSNIVNLSFLKVYKTWSPSSNNDSRNPFDNQVLFLDSVKG